MTLKLFVLAIADIAQKECHFYPFLFEEKVCACVFKCVMPINNLVFDKHVQINT